MGKKDRIFLTGISVLLVLSLSPIVFNEAFAGIPNGNEMPPAVGPIGDFRCWLTDAPPPPPTVFPLSLTDQFGEMILGPGQIGPAIEFCASAVKNGEPGQFDISQHFTGYPLMTEPMPERTVRVFIPQFGIDIPELRVSQPTELLVPTTKISPIGEPFPNLTGLHYKCYDISENLPVRIPGHLLVTQFFPETILDEELKPKYLCNPTIKTLPTGERFGAEIREHLICFEKPGEAAPGVQIANQFTENQLVPIPLPVAEKVCYEAIKTEIEIDQFDDSIGSITLQLQDGSIEIVALSGPTTVHVGIDPDGRVPFPAPFPSGSDSVPIEIVSMSLTGDSSFGPIEVRIPSSLGLPTLGEIVEDLNLTPEILDIPPFTPTGTADSFFDVFFEIELSNGLILNNIDPFRITGVITHKPPAPGDTYEKMGDPVELFDPAGQSTGIFIVDGAHTPNPPPDGGIPIGGELIPIDTTSLLLAGTQMTASWMIPVIVAGIGFVIIIVRRK